MRALIALAAVMSSNLCAIYILWCQLSVRDRHGSRRIYGRHGNSFVPVVPSVIATTRCSTSLYTWSPCRLGAFVVQIVPSIVPFVFATAHAAHIYTWSPRGVGAIVVPILCLLWSPQSVPMVSLAACWWITPLPCSPLGLHPDLRPPHG